MNISSSGCRTAAIRGDNDNFTALQQALCHLGINLPQQVDRQEIIELVARRSLHVALVDHGQLAGIQVILRQQVIRLDLAGIQGGARFLFRGEGQHGRSVFRVSPVQVRVKDRPAVRIGPRNRSGVLFIWIDMIRNTSPTITSTNRGTLSSPIRKRLVNTCRRYSCQATRKIFFILPLPAPVPRG